MLDVFALRNQDGQYLSKSREWLSEGDSKTLFRSPHRDDIINEKVELSVKRPDLRIRSISVQQADNGRLSIDGEDCLKKAQAEAVANSNVDEPPTDDTPASFDSDTSESDQHIDLASDLQLTEPVSQPEPSEYSEDIHMPEQSDIFSAEFTEAEPAPIQADAAEQTLSSDTTANNNADMYESSSNCDENPISEREIAKNANKDLSE